MVRRQLPVQRDWTIDAGVCLFRALTAFRPGQFGPALAQADFDAKFGRGWRVLPGLAEFGVMGQGKRLPRDCRYALEARDGETRRAWRESPPVGLARQRP